jgi:hypothetical protein
MTEYEQIVLDALKKPQTRKKLEELKEKTLLTGKEYVFGVCSDGKITKMIEGTENSVNARDIASECNNKVNLHIHSHPRPYLDKDHNISYPSEEDWFMDLWLQPKLASCFYDADYDTINCYTIPARIRDKYASLIKKAETEANSYVASYMYAKDEKDKKRYSDMYIKKKAEYIKNVNEAVKEVITNIYPEHDFKDFAWPSPIDPQGHELYMSLAKTLPRWGNYNGVWLGKYNFNELYK